MNEMKRTSRLSLVFIAVCWIAISLGLLAPEKAGLENRNLRTWAQIDFWDTNINAFANQLKVTLNDNFLLKNDLVRLINTFETRVFGQRGDQNFLLGENDWEFYRGDENIEQAIGVLPLTGTEVLQTTKNVYETITRMESKKIPFKLFVVPSKPTVYAGLLPSHLRPSSERLLVPVEQVIDKLSEDHVTRSILYPKRFFKEAKDMFETPIYEPKGTHWNDLGAYLGYQSLMESLGEKPVDLGYFKIDFVTDYKSLSGFYLPTFSNTDYLDSPVLSKFKNVHSKQKLNSILVFGDSFSEKLIPFLYAHFDRVHFVPSRVVKYEIVEMVKPDVVIHQIAERYFKNVYSSSFLLKPNDVVENKINEYFDEHFIIDVHASDRSNFFNSSIQTNISVGDEIYRKVFETRVDKLNIPTDAGKKNLTFEFPGGSRGVHISFKGRWLDLDYQESGGSNLAIIFIQHNGAEAKIEFAKNEVFVGGAIASKPLGIKNVEEYEKIDMFITELGGTVVFDENETYQWPVYKTGSRGKSVVGLGNFSTSPLRGPKAQFERVLVRPFHLDCSNLPCVK